MTFRNFCPLLVSFSVISTALGQPTPAKPLRPAKVVSQNENDVGALGLKGLREG